MNVKATKPLLTSTQRKAFARQIARLREELEDLQDSLDAIEARARNLGKPTYSHAEVKEKFGIK